MRDAYRRIFARTGLDFRVVEADSGAIGGSRSEEFHVLAESGEDDIAFNDAGTYAANLELTPAPPPPERAEATEAMREVDTPDVRTIDDVSRLLGVPPVRCLKTLFVEGADDGPVALVLRGDHDLNLVKAARVEGVRVPVALAAPEAVREAAGAGAGAVGPVGLAGPVVVDRWAAAAADFVCGANRDDAHLAGVNWGRDLPEPATADLRNAVEGDPSPDGRGSIAIRRGIEVGHVFQLGRKYSESMHAVCLDEDGRARTLEMGCYGIGVSRIAAAAIEQNHDENGIIWPDAIAPFEVALLPMNAHRSGRVRERAEALHEELRAAGIEVLLDDRPVRPGVMFSEMDLIGVPHRLVLGERRLDEGTIEYRSRRGGETELVALEEAAAVIAARLDRRARRSLNSPGARRDSPFFVARALKTGEGLRLAALGRLEERAHEGNRHRTLGGEGIAVQPIEEREQVAHVAPLAGDQVARHQGESSKAPLARTLDQHPPELLLPERGEAQDRGRGEARREVGKTEAETSGRRAVGDDERRAGALEGVEQPEQGLLPLRSPGRRTDSVEAHDPRRLQPFGHLRPDAGLGRVEVEAVPGPGGGDQQMGLAGPGRSGEVDEPVAPTAADSRTASTASPFPPGTKLSNDGGSPVANASGY